MPAKYKFSPERLDEIKRLTGLGKTRSEIAKIIGESYESIRSALRYRKIEHKRSYEEWSPERLHDARRKLKAGLTIKEVEDLLNVSSLDSVLRYHGIRIESRAIRLGEIVAKRKRLESAQTREDVTRARYTQKLHPLMIEIAKLLPPYLPRFLRDDIGQEVILAILEGEILTKELVRKKFKLNIKQYSLHTGAPLSLDEPLPGSKTGRKLHEYIDSRTRDFFASRFDESD